MNLDMNMILSFKKVAELQHVSKAAEELYISQAHLSRIIAALEKEIGAPLFDRSGRGITLNACGKLYYDYVLRILALLDESIKNVREEHLRSQIQLIVSTNVGAYLPDLFQNLLDVMPNIRFKQYSLSRNGLQRYMKNNRTDFHLICPPEDSEDLISIPLHKETAVVIYPENHWLEGREKVFMHELAQENFVGVNQGYGARDAVEIMYREHQFKPNFVIETADTAMVSAYVRKGLGIGVVPKAIILKDTYFRNHFCHFEEDVYGIVALEWKRERVLNDIDIAFCNMSLRHFHELGKVVGTNFHEEVPVLKDFIEVG